MNLRRVAVTGIGCVSCAGGDFPSTWESLIRGRSGIAPVTLFPADGLPDAAGEVRDFSLAGIVTPKQERRMARAVRFAAAAAAEAMRQARLPAAAERSGDPFRFGALIACGAGGVEEYDRAAAILADRGPGAVSPFFIPKYMSNSAAATVAMLFGLRGPCFNPVSACASGSHAIGEAMWMIRRGDADLMLAGGAEAPVTRLMMSGFHSLTALSTATPPERACRPFDRDRDGFVLAEGAAVLVLEELEHARARGAAILAEIAGYGASCDACHITAPDPEALGMTRAILNALETAQCPPSEVGCISAHGTGTAANDRCETRAIRRAFGERLAPKIRVSAIKSMIGHALSASGAMAAAAAVRTLRTGIVPPTINYGTPDPECELDVTPNRAGHTDSAYLLVNSLGFGGHNAALLLKRWEDG